MTSSTFGILSSKRIRGYSGIVQFLRSRPILQLALVLLAVCAAYANHFHNGFHFDDSHTVQNNPYIRNLRNIPHFFTDAKTFSVLPANQTYRPMVSTSLAIDYALGHGYNPFWFHLSTFFVFLAQLVAMYVFFAVILKAVRPDAKSGAESDATIRCISLLAVAWYGLHPAMAETVNYIIQRGDIYCAFGMVTALVLYAQLPQWRNTRLYLAPFVFAMLSKPPAVVFPVLLFLYIAMFEKEAKGHSRTVALAVAPSLAVCAILLWLQSAMTPRSFTPSTISAYSYIATQPYVLFRYFLTLFFPFHLNVDTDLNPFPSLTPAAWGGFVFVAALIAVAWWAAQRKDWRPISFGLLWFLITSLPTSLYRLSEVENDHRMYMPFIGLVLAIVWAGFLMIEKLAARGDAKIVWRAAIAASVVLLALYAYGTHVRNRVWRAEESLWLDDVQKCPHNGRGLMNYGLTQMANGKYSVALDYFERALIYTPNYPTLEINLGVVNGAVNRTAEAEQHFQRAIALAPADDNTHFFYGRWLFSAGRVADALLQLQATVRLNPSRVDASDLLAAAYDAVGDHNQAVAAAAAALQLDPADTGARAILVGHGGQTAGDWINASLYRYQAGNYQASIAAAQQALRLDPQSVAAYNNIGAAYAGLKQWDLAIENERTALRIQPEFQLAKNNLALYTQMKKGAAAQPPNATAEDWLEASLRDYQAHLYAQSIADAREALKARPHYAEAYNNIAADDEEMHKWDDAIAAAREALRLKPDFPLAKNNLAWSLQQKSAEK